MNHHFDLSNLEFEKKFESCQLKEELFNHEAHLRLAWIHVCKYGIDKAIENIQTQIRNYAIHVGATKKYNKTLTIVAIKIVNSFKQQFDSKDFRKFIAEYPVLIHNFKSLIDQHYSFDIYNSEKAKSEFLEPDLLPFD